MRLIAATLLCAMQATASGEVHKLLCKRGDVTETGTAVSVGETSDGRVVLFTAAHCVRLNRKGVFVGGGTEWCRAEVIDATSDTSVDFAVLLSRIPGKTTYTKLGDLPSVGDSVVFTGFSYGTKYERIQNRVRTWTDTGRKGFWTAGETSRSGQSGGPCFDKNMRLVGVLSGGKDGANTFTSVAYMRARWQKVCTPYGCRYVRVNEPAPVVRMKPVTRPTAGNCQQRFAALEREIASLKATIKSLKLKQGKDGADIESVSVSQSQDKPGECRLLMKMSDGRYVRSGPFNLRKGPKGDRGPAGESAVHTLNVIITEKGKELHRLEGIKLNPGKPKLTVEVPVERYRRGGN